MDSSYIDDVMEVTTQMDLLKERIEYNENIFGSEETYTKVLSRLLDDSLYIGLSLRYPYEDYSDMPLPRKYENWQLRACCEIYQGIGREGIKSYAENGLSWTRDSGYLSNSLVQEIEPMVGYIKKESDIDVSTNQ